MNIFVIFICLILITKADYCGEYGTVCTKQSDSFYIKKSVMIATDPNNQIYSTNSTITVFSDSSCHDKIYSLIKNENSFFNRNNPDNSHIEIYSLILESSFLTVYNNSTFFSTGLSCNIDLNNDKLYNIFLVSCYLGAVDIFEGTKLSINSKEIVSYIFDENTHLDVMINNDFYSLYGNENNVIIIIIEILCVALLTIPVYICIRRECRKPKFSRDDVIFN
ncbi:hypothetical protein WA158_002197 [Blastocystis sp. Blastoise]